MKKKKNMLKIFFLGTRARGRTLIRRSASYACQTSKRDRYIKTSIEDPDPFHFGGSGSRSAS